MCPLLIFLWLGLSECFPKAVARSLPAGLYKVLGDSLSNGATANPTDTAKTTSTTIVIDPIPAPTDSLVKDSDLVVVPPDIPKPSITYNMGCSVGTIGGSLSVGSLGGAGYSLKIETPDGGSLTPQIGLAYDSQSGGYGLAGYGFNITGISAITRGGHDMFHDGSQSGVTYTAADNLYLDGKRLILQSGSSGQSGSVYTVEGDPFTKVTAHGKYDNSTVTTWFEVTTRTGMTYEYGNSSTSRLAYTNKSGHPRIASWYISSATGIPIISITSTRPATSASAPQPLPTVLTPRRDGVSSTKSSFSIEISATKPVRLCWKINKDGQTCVFHRW